MSEALSLLDILYDVLLVLLEIPERLVTLLFLPYPFPLSSPEPEVETSSRKDVSVTLGMSA